ncbi:MAG: FAD-dependent oxidoreductase [Planctomycetota bacterium]|nr:FAD-dependent oxidoreductase [Planctomycetota bacterium]MDG1984111.1 FAD-dependent oxidoreductase [Planctomycetota bacterium]
MPTSLQDLLPEDLAQRCLRLDGSPRQGGEFVLLWIRSAMRAASNPALEAACAVSNRLGLPLLVYQGLDARHPFASDRLWTFVLEGARDLAEDLERRGLEYAFHLTRPGHQQPALRELAGRSALVLCDAAPVEPLSGWTTALAEAVEAPVVEVDAACVVPMTATRKAYERAFAFKNASKKARKAWLGWEPEEQPAPARYRGELGFEPVDLGSADIADLVAACEVDHGIGPVAHTVGGARAGTARWEAFRDQRLARYARDRNDALRPGVSRLSAYLHFGMVSPLTIARECQAIGGGGADKFLDELLVWREAAWHFCHHAGVDLDTLAAIPEWARETLDAHRGDERPDVREALDLEQARTGDPLWDAAQRSLLRHGELHNNLRMTWGKALVPWSPSPEVALARLVELNHRYALDGRDPSSYGGLLWCLGQFDRPFPPAEPITGELRGRSTDFHASRLDVEKYGARSSSPVTPKVRVAVVGGGLCGLAAAQALEDAGHEVVVLDKGRGVGGRTSTRRADPYAFDHGAQYFTARDPRFRRVVEMWVEEGVVEPWEGRLAVLDEPGAPQARTAGANDTRFVGVPGMNAMARRTARGLDVRCGSRVTGLERRGDRWGVHLEDGRPLGEFDLVLVTTPPAQAAPLLTASPRLEALAAAVEMDPCVAAMVAFDSPLDVPFDGAFVNKGPLSWICRNSSKPGRPAGETWVLHGGADWSREHFEGAKDEVISGLLAALHAVTGAPLPAVLHQDWMRWLYSSANPPGAEGAALDADLGLGVAGDWLNGSKVQGAWLSGKALAGRVLGALSSSEARSPWG